MTKGEQTRLSAWRLKVLQEAKVARSSVHRILVRHGLNRLPANQKRNS